MTVPIDNDGNPIAPMEVQSVLTLILMIGVGGWLLRRWGGRTPGKRLTGLRVEGSDSTRWWLGECLRLLPAVIVTGLSVIVAAVGTSALTSVLSVFGSPVGLLATVIGSMGLVFWFYILPILRWRGQAWYDRMTGTFVVRG